MIVVYQFKDFKLWWTQKCWLHISPYKYKDKTLNIPYVLDSWQIGGIFKRKCSSTKEGHVNGKAYLRLLLFLYLFLV